jgi:hypothetical protein
MYGRQQYETKTPENFKNPFDGQLDAENRWVKMSKMIPWEEYEEEYAKNFTEEKGAPAKSFRMALGALIIKEMLGISDRETVEQIKENPYLQYFIGMESYSSEEAFNASMMVHFRKRIGMELINKINKEMVKKFEGVVSEKKENEGQLLLDATCTPADIKYPTDIEILNEAREKTEETIDELYKQIQGKEKKKPRTYRVAARKDYLEIVKKRRVSKKERRKGIKKQLQYVKRNLSHIEKMIEEGAKLEKLTKKEQEELVTIRKVYEQQLEMYAKKTNKVENRIVSITQPHIRPIVRGKAGKAVEFGAKISASSVNGFVFLDKLSWNNYNESGDLQERIEEYKKERGCYLESVHVDKIYRTKANRAYCKERGIRMSGPRLGRPPKEVSKEKKEEARSDERVRNAIEGKFGQGKRRFSLGRVMAKLPETSETVIAMNFLLMNLSTLLQKTKKKTKSKKL